MAGVEQIKYTPGKSMHVKLVAPTRVHNKHYDIGQIIDLPEQLGYELIAAMKAVRHHVDSSLAPKK